MPTEKRGSIGSVKPTGWQITRYDGVVEGGYLYNRCHLLAYMLTAENANKCNLITGTRYLNQTMIPFENKACDYVKNTGNHVMYRVTPVFEGENLVASGLLMEARSVEDGGEGVCYNVYCYNVQPKVIVDYATGESRLADDNTSSDSGKKETYSPNTKSKRFHTTDCSVADDISEENRKKYTGTRQSLIDDGYTPCQRCKP
jgi:DNA-entry nuclease